jgi:glutamate N-acetyltransferase/amino-acid N-acetyltransferase
MNKLPKGFLANGIHCGLKKKRKDLSLFYSEKDCRVSALFTTNVVKAAPVVLGMELLRKKKPVRAVLVNSGNAKCMTGARGIEDAKKMIRLAAKELGVPETAVLVSSTGIIGEPMPMGPVDKGIHRVVKGLSRAGLNDAAEGIMTTDRFAKKATRVFSVGNKKVTVTGVAKGAGMIHPNMATMLGYILTDANITKRALDKALSDSTNASFNAISVDGDMSTNDTIVLLANGAAGNRLISRGGRDFALFQKNIDEVTGELAKMIVRDGEGASKFIEVHVKGARTNPAAKKAARAVAGSMLVKCAVQGGDPNWGRIASSIGSSGIRFDPDKMEIKMDGVTFFRHGHAVSSREEETGHVFKGKDVLIEVNLHRGKGEATFCSCDISKRYITLNSYYTT